MCPRDPCAPPPPLQERVRHILFCSWNMSEHEKWRPPSPNWDGLPVGPPSKFSGITFSPITQFLR